MKYTAVFHDAASDLYVFVTGVKGEGELQMGVLVNPKAGTVGSETPTESIVGHMPYADFQPFKGDVPAAVKQLIDSAPEPQEQGSLT